MSAKVNVDPNVLVWFRKDAGYDDVNSLPKSIRGNVIKWESGEKKPTWNQLRQLGNKYKRPATFFLIKNPKKSFEEEFTDYRTLTEITTHKSPNFIYEIRRAIKRRNIILDLLDQDITSFNPFSSIEFTKKNTLSYSHIIRKILEINIEEQMKWGREDNKHYFALKEWKKAVENLNILIFETRGVDVEEFRGLSISEFPFPIILLNGSDSPNARIFTLLHELIHIIQNNNAICDLTETRTIEVFCNRLAGEILVPENYLEELIEQNRIVKFIDNDIVHLSHIFGVSRDVILTRLRILNKISQTDYDQTINRWKEEYLQKPKQERGGGAFDYRTILKLNGRLFTKVVIDAYEKGDVNSVEFSRYLGGVKLKHIPDLQESVGGK